MESEAVLQELLVSRALDTLPSPAREAVLQDGEFRGRWGLEIKVGLTLGNDGPAFQRDRLFEALRVAIDEPGRWVDIADDDDLVWRARVDLRDDGEPTHTIAHGDRSIRIEDHSALARSQTIRAAWLERTATTLLPPREWVDRRSDQLAAGPLTDEAFVELMDDLEAMPARVDAGLRAGLRRGEGVPGLFVPKRRDYYERLVGTPAPDMTADTYIDGVIGPMVGGLVRRHGVAGLRQGLLCCSHPRIATYLPLDAVDRGDLVDLFEKLAVQGDPVSRIGAVEAALAHLPDMPELEPHVERVVQALLQEVDGAADLYTALSALIAMATGDLARRHVLEAAPPFYRRQAAIAQASLVLRALIDTQRDMNVLRKWVEETGLKEVWFMQALIDLRREPRYLPEYAMPVQLRAEVIGRLLIAGMEHEDKIVSEPLRSLMVGFDCTLRHAAPWPLPFLPGPLEGTSKALTPPPDELLERARDALEAAQLEAQSFNMVIQLAALSGDVDELAALAFSALSRVNYLVDTDDDATAPFATLMGLSILAGSARTPDLAEAVRVLARVKRRHGTFDGNPENEVRIALVAAAAFEEIDAWARFVGDWITEVSFALGNRERAGNLLRLVRHLRNLEPALLRHVSSAEAALSALHRQHGT